MQRFEQQVLESLPRLRRYARSLSRSSEDAEDLVQDCVEKAFARRGTWRGDNLQGWLMTILSNLNRNRSRQSGRMPVSDGDLDSVPADLAEPDPLERDRLVAALDRLSADYRSVLMLVVIEGYLYAEVAQILGIPLGTVMSRLSRARSALAAALEQDNIVEFRRNT